ncbi:error-prone DNA polymerase [Pseudomonas violetae]|uniref:Error-prone DNA polymerase n=1 Tax=Pseudomonas violetae TaxID=2915813 RepID=A0ABT0ET30_9PSED|nr:error-prone DNA polymerase [Pseudomonas violetae]MCK1788890.1 error-prone DNA polymerase [Pseudomonas violetae]
MQPPSSPSNASSFAELHCLSNFTFQRGASTLRQLFERAHALGYQALAITDECTMAGAVRAWQVSKEVGLRFICGTELQIEQGPKLVLLAESLAGYQAICGIISTGRRNSTKGTYRLTRGDFDRNLSGVLALWVPPVSSGIQDTTLSDGRWLAGLFPDCLWIAVGLHFDTDNASKLQYLKQLGEALRLPLVAAGDVHMHSRGRRALQDTLTAIRNHKTVFNAGQHLFQNGERHLRSKAVLESIYAPELMDESVRIAERCTFTLDQIRYQYPHELVPTGMTASQCLRQLVKEGVPWRWPDGPPGKAIAQIEHELALISELGFDCYFLCVHDIVRFARQQKILCQGRGSAANSAVCFVLGITELDPSRSKLLFERFISRERNEPPDIDIDFEHERREEVIQYIYQRYGRDRAALTAVATTYHYASAVRDVAKALDMPADEIERLAKSVGRGDEVPSAEQLEEAGFDPQEPALHRVMVLTAELIGFPRHLSQHPGGFVISDAPLSTLVPVENAAMPDRTIIQWDKDDLDALGLLKVDILALGMLTAIRRTLDMLRRYDLADLTMATVPKEDPATYEMISSADTVGVFQIESRAQQSMLPRLRPKTFYDLVIQIAIVRPGPIAGDMVHPYIRRRNGEEKVEYASEELKEVLERTLGVPLFQEQVMQIAIVAAGYTPGEADQLRKSMAAWKRQGGLEPHQKRLMEGMLSRGYSEEFAAKIFTQILAFGHYGFPESHSSSFSIICYVSAFLRCHFAAAFAAALINSHPMGFYTPDQLLQDVRRRGVDTRPIDVNISDWDCTLELGADPQQQPAIRLGLRLVRGLQDDVAHRIAAARQHGLFLDVSDLCHRVGLDKRARDLLSDSGALKELAGNRHQSRWAVAGVEKPMPLFDSIEEQATPLPQPSLAQDLFADYATLGTTLGPHPLRLLRQALIERRCKSSRDLLDWEHGKHVVVAGLVTGRQRPGTANGVTFVTLEDEYGTINVVVWKDLGERQRKELRGSQLLQVKGRFENQKGVRHVIAGHLEDVTSLLGELDVRSRDYH